MSRYINHSDGTVTDTKTSLRWSKPFEVSVSFSKTDKVVSSLGVGWRLPTIDELHSIVDRSRYSPAIDTDFFTVFSKSNYWSSTPCAWNKKLMWTVGFDSGCVEYVAKTYLAYVVAVYDLDLRSN